MNLEEFIKRMKRIRKHGYIKSTRGGNTGIGYTLELELGLKENNISKPDLGIIELKAQRRGSKSKITLFTKDKGAWLIRPKEVILEYGRTDQRGRLGLYCTISNKPNPQGFYTLLAERTFYVRHVDGLDITAWMVEDLAATLSTKMPNLIIVIADRRVDSTGREEFWYNEAYYLEGVNEEKFVEYLNNGTVTVDFRMHIKSGGSVRNHGTAFRIEERFLPDLFSLKIDLLGSELNDILSRIKT